MSRNLIAALMAGAGLAACAQAAESGASETDAAVTSELSGALFVGNKREDSLSKVDLSAGSEVKRVDTCANPHELSTSPDGEHVVLACYGGTSVDIFTTSDLTKVKSIELGENARPHGIVWHSSGAIAATAEGRGTLYVIDDPLSDEPTVRELGENKGPGPHMVAVDDGFTTGWGVVIPTGEVIRYDLASGSETARTSVGGVAEAVALSPDASSLWVGSNVGGTAFLLDPATLEIREEIATGNFPIRIAPHPSGMWVVTSNVAEGTLSVIDTATRKTVRTIQVSEGDDTVLVTLIFSDDGERLYAAQTRSNLIAEIDFAEGKVIRRFKVGEGGDGLAVLDAS
jgi:DNA-binding beta-propeller fold protein YncE